VGFYGDDRAFAYVQVPFFVWKIIKPFWICPGN
jgi:hypothetical protein